MVLWTLGGNGVLKLDYDTKASGDVDFAGITFDCAEKELRSRRWLGAGPYRVWKNRMKGTAFGLWEQEVNDNEPGKVWVFPEFKGYFADFHWSAFKTETGGFVIGTETPGMFLRVLTPKLGPKPRGDVKPPFPPGAISVLHAIPAIGTKFKKSRDLGPKAINY